VALRSAAALSDIDHIARYDILNPKALRSVIGSGAQLRAFPNEVVDAAYDASKGLYEELSSKSASFKKMYESMLTFQRESAVWNQVSEYAYDTTVMRSLRR
jgi:TRAP-type mannitol/chloroaromatic compound transport system substrate-binding protein